MNLDIVNESKLLGTFLTDKLTWDKNTKELTKKAYKRMQLLPASWYTNSKVDLKSLYLTYIRSIFEQSAVTWQA